MRQSIVMISGYVEDQANSTLTWGDPMSQSYDEDVMTSLGITNAGWGICGFTSSLYAMYHINPAARRFLIAAPQPWSVLYEIEEYLERLIQTGANEVLSKIEDFTRSFGGKFATYTAQKYIQNIRESWDKYTQDNSPQAAEKVMSDSSFGLALPPDCAADYLRRMWGYDAKWEFTGGSTKDGLIGVKDVNDKKMVLYDGLRHYIYQKNQKLYSWGESFSDLADVNKKKGRNYSVCCMITI
jgi:hypothetical protein